jgi:hypothetical protein
MSLLLMTGLGLMQPVDAEPREDARQASADDEDDDLAFYDSNAGTYYVGIWQHLTTPRKLENHPRSQVANPASPLTEENSNAY